MLLVDIIIIEHSNHVIISFMNLLKYYYIHLIRPF